MARACDNKIALVTGAVGGIDQARSHGSRRRTRGESTAVMWLWSDGASFMTSHALPLDGGYVAR